ncbi:Tudor domain [Trinorchestia longiramus]|nr:Tudor domain [Trinorchestia longiramus]
MVSLWYGSRRILSASACGFKPAELPLADQLSWKIKVVYVENAGRLWVISEGASTETLHFVISTINLALSSDDALPIPAQKFAGEGLPVNEPVLAPRHDASGAVIYARAQIESLRSSPKSHDKNGGKIIKVFFVDYGHSALVSSSSLKQMPEVLVSVPRLAVECSLSHVRPVSSSCGGAAWSDAANHFASTRLSDKTFIAKVYSVVHDVVRIELYDKLPPPVNQFKCFNSFLIQKGFAVLAQESLESQDDHRSRQQYMNSANRIYGGPRSASCFGSSELTLGFSYLPRSSVLSTLSPVPDSISSCIRPTRNKSRLMGPYSPLQLQFHCLQFATQGKKVCVECDSINSTALDMEPQNPHDRLLVSSFVSVTGDQQRLIARNTTLMPAVPGLLSICCLTFCHLANMRVSEDGCEYTGAIIGLGADPETGFPVYPDEDIELAFDIPFTNLDLEKINKVRYLLNWLLYGPVGRRGALDSAARAERQKHLRSSLLELLDEHRPYKRPVASRTPYKWNVIPSSSLLMPITKPEEMLEGAPVYPLHCGVILRPHTPSTLLQRTAALARDYADMMCNSSGSRYMSSRIWERCYACDKQLLLTMQDVGHHLTSDKHRQNLQTLKLMKQDGL